MTPDDWSRIRSLFDNALEHPESERTAFLRRACPDAPALRAEVASLLDAHEHAEATHAFESPFRLEEEDGLKGTRPPRDETDRRVGPYRLVRQLGRGGMGTVYLAERVDGQFRQTVALKLIRWGLDTDETLARFASERQILADLDHPNIARLYDGGVTEDGRPYFAMEYVEGEPITDYCDRHQFSITQRLALFRTVCRAVQHAHRNLIVHRDLKPSNILVTEGDEDDEETGGAQIKLLDFGIAKLLAEDALDATLGLPRTRTGQQALTPVYAAPEQLKGTTITTATDVYQLGVLLYELLTGWRPYRAKGRMRHEVAQTILEETPVAPSKAVGRRPETENDDTTEPATPNAVAQARSTDPNGLRRALAGDLDVICLKALKKDPERRYADVDALADDLERHMTGRPVEACPDSVFYRAGKFIRRHSLGVAAVVLIVLSLVGGTGVVLWQARVADQQRQRAEQRLTDVRELAGSFLFEFHDAIDELPGSTPARELVVRRAQEYLSRLSQQARNDPSLRLDLAVAYGKLGDVQGNPTNANLGRTQAALASYRTGLDFVRDVLAHGSIHAEARSVQANLYEKLGDVQAATGALAAAEESKRRSADLYRKLARADTASRADRSEYAVALIKLGDLLGNPNFPNRGQHDEALAQYREAEPILARLYAADSSTDNTMRLYGLIYERIGTIHDVEGRTGAALQSYRRSLSIRERYADANPSNTDAIRDLAVAHEKMGDMLVQQGDLETARTRYQESLGLFRQLSKADPENVQAQKSLAISHMHLGDLAHHPSRPSFDEPSVARRHYENAQSLLQSVLRVDSTRTDTRARLDRVNERLAELPDGS